MKACSIRVMKMAWFLTTLVSCSGPSGPSGSDGGPLDYSNPMLHVVGLVSGHMNQAEKRDFVLNSASCALSYTCALSDPRAQVLMTSCPLASGLVQTGRMKLAFSSADACSRHRDTPSLYSGDSFTRTFQNASSVGVDESLSFFTLSGQRRFQTTSLGSSQVTFLSGKWRLQFLAGFERAIFSGSSSTPTETLTIQSSSDLIYTVSGDLREVESGVVEVVSSLNANRSLSFDLSSLEWDLEKCCQPVGGTLSVNITSTLGSADPDGVGTETYAFEGCRSVTYTNLSGTGATRSFSLGCE